MEFLGHTLDKSTIFLKRFLVSYFDFLILSFVLGIKKD
ncbi:hypothetical protein HMPREF9320_1597 [Streptococcus pseudoporcinus SPIN 20026]|nr:hypothetical protein HMPREF9320_1597 [Streptococcus pseudoporcinus SPIN 20026]